MTAAYLLEDADLLAACSIETYRSSGPGGQHANRTESAVRLTHRDSGVVASCQNHRHQDRNRKDALGLLRLRLAISQDDPVEIALLKPFKKNRQIRCGSGSPNYYKVVAVALYVLRRAQGGLGEAASHLEVSSSQLAKVLLDHKEVAQAANGCRESHGLGPLKRR